MKFLSRKAGCEFMDGEQVIVSLSKETPKLALERGMHISATLTSLSRLNGVWQAGIDSSTIEEAT